MSYDDEQYYPTPAPLAHKMATALGKGVTTLLEPSAGDGALIEAYKQAFCGKYSRGPQILCCEINEARRNGLARQGHRVIGSDFLKSRVADYYYDAVLMNPPFRNGLKHVRHAYENLAPGGKIVALINNAQIVRCGQEDYAFFTKLTNEGMKVEPMHHTFRDAKRETDVTVAMLVAEKPKDARKEDDFSDIFQDLNDERAKAANGGDMPSDEGLVAYDLITDIVARYNASLNHHAAVRKSHAGMKKLLPVSIDDKVLKMPAAFSTFEKELRDGCWDRIFRETGISDIMTRSIRKDFTKFCETQRRIEFTVENIQRLCASMAADLNRIRERACREMFDDCTRYADNNHWNSWKTNSSWKVGDKIILPCFFEKDWSGGTVSLRYNSQDTVDDYEKALCLLTGRRLADVSKAWSTGSARVQSSIAHRGSKVEPGKWNESEFFDFKGHKNGTLHLRWRDPQVRKDFQELAARGDSAIGFTR